MYLCFFRFHGEVTGYPRPEVVWFKDGNEISPDGLHYVSTYTENGEISLTVHACTDADDAEYMVLAENIAGIDKCNFELFVDLPGVHETNNSNGTLKLRVIAKGY